MLCAQKTISNNTDVNNEANKSNECFVMEIKITDMILTPLSCAYIVNEFIKCLVYQKSQIPYPYNWLETMVKKKRSEEEEKPKVHKNFTVARHYQQAAAAYDSLDQLMKELMEEFKKSKSVVREIVIGFGTVPQCITQAYRIHVSELASNHIEKNHVNYNIKQQHKILRLVVVSMVVREIVIGFGTVLQCITQVYRIHVSELASNHIGKNQVNDTNKQQHKILRNIFMSQAWMDFLDVRLNSLNMYVFLRKSATHPTDQHENTFFVPSKDLNFTSSTKQMHIHLKYLDSLFTNVECCRFEIFNEKPFTANTVSNTDNLPNISHNSSSESCWFEARFAVKGFKECFINKASASELW